MGKPKMLGTMILRDPSQELTTRPTLKYLGFVLLLAWHYCLWFVPNVFPNTFLLADVITFSWLIELAVAGLVLLVLPQLLKQRQSLSANRAVTWVSTLLACVGTLVFVFAVSELTQPVWAYLLSACLGVAGALLWLLWGEHYALIRARFSIRHVAPAYGICFLVSLGLASFLPAPFATAFVALLPLLSGAILLLTRRDVADQSYPRLLPRKTARQGMKSIISVCFISFATCTVCYFYVAIVDWQALPYYVNSFTIGVLAGALFILLIAVLGTLFAQRFNIFRVFNWLLVLTALAGTLLLTSVAPDFATFVIALMVASVFEVLLTMYFGLLTLKGYCTPVLAFGLAAGSIRLGIAFGNSWAIVYERLPEFAERFSLIPLTSLLFAVVTVALLIPLVRQEFNIAVATSVPQTSSELEQVCSQMAEAFNLSERETGIALLVARGFSTNAIAEKLVISPHTVNTHIQHIYGKMSIHKRSELFRYINLHSEDNPLGYKR